MKKIIYIFVLILILVCGFIYYFYIIDGNFNIGQKTGNEEKEKSQNSLGQKEEDKNPQSNSKINWSEESNALLKDMEEIPEWELQEYMNRLENKLSYLAGDRKFSKEEIKEIYLELLKANYLKRLRSEEKISKAMWDIEYDKINNFFIKKTGLTYGDILYKTLPVSPNIKHPPKIEYDTKQIESITVEIKTILADKFPEKKFNEDYLIQVADIIYTAREYEKMFNTGTISEYDYRINLERGNDIVLEYFGIELQTFLDSIDDKLLNGHFN
ncbi:MAG: hypothetical protein UR27_C0006G0050 [Candidatus Peregrinibacteria bacterium GW2011_GWA2_33_10]|nr:MAG: hypothetical protein UR27_C0006G0050 [Candidatus Peregrinibacteria bacterium GW2011_GWA2_33_10]KKP39580.1 MAG: hypothetical protein UR30_C0009G0001 [Candidatus Peregrinibacteria bacterium GW2011_GWC2_33_13]